MSWYFFGGFSAYCTLPSGRQRNHSGCSFTHGWSGATWNAMSIAISMPASRGRDQVPEIGERAELGDGSPCGRPRRRRWPMGCPRRPLRASGMLLRPLRLLAPDRDGSAAGRATSKPIAAIYVQALLARPRTCRARRARRRPSAGRARTSVLKRARSRSTVSAKAMVSRRAVARSAWRRASSMSMSSLRESPQRRGVLLLGAAALATRARSSRSTPFAGARRFGHELARPCARRARISAGSMRRANPSRHDAR